MSLFLTHLWLTMRPRTPDEGATLVEYALLVVLIAVAAIVALRTLGGAVSDEVCDVANTISGASC